jgi:hypothetical protein
MQKDNLKHESPTDANNVLADSAYDEKKDFTCGCLYTCNVCLEADRLNLSRREHYDKTVNDDWD